MVNDEFGIKLLFPSSTTNEQYLSFPQSVSAVQNSNFLQKKILAKGTFALNAIGDTIFWYEFQKISDNQYTIISVLPSSLEMDSNNNITLDVDCDLDYEEAHDRGYVNDSW